MTIQILLISQYFYLVNTAVLYQSLNKTRMSFLRVSPMINGTKKNIIEYQLLI